jgi:FMN phosphatase YigB (HAD superfamily)
MGHGKSAYTAENRRLAVPAGQTYLPIFETVVFFDWFGTLSTSRFWDGITQAGRHALKRRLSERLQQLFSVEKETISLWMRGELTDADIVEHLDIPLPRHYGEDYLHRALHRDCRASAVRPGMAELVRGLRSRALVAVATDNMACFLAAVPTVLNDEAPVDAILSSAERRVLKAEDPQRFFAPMLDATGFAFSHAVLIDDCAKTCAAFRELGGRAYQYTSVPRLLEELGRDPAAALRGAAWHAALAIGRPAVQLSLFADPGREHPHRTVRVVGLSNSAVGTRAAPRL